MIRIQATTVNVSESPVSISLIAYPLYGDRPYFIDMQGRFLGFVETKEEANDEG